MSNTDSHHQTPGPRRAWTAPHVVRLRSGDAALGTRVSTSDGGFTTS